MKIKLILLTLCLLSLSVEAQTKLYDEEINPLSQIEEAVSRARAEQKNVVCQLGGNWCIWCLRFADFIQKDSVINDFVQDNFVYIHVNYPRRGTALGDIPRQVSERLAGADRFGFPALVVLNPEGQVIHIQDSGYLEEGKGYDHDKVLRFFKNWSPAALNRKKE